MDSSSSPSNLSRSSFYRIKALVLRHQNLGDSDRLITVLSTEYGKLRLSVRGARKTKSRLGGHVEPLIYGDFLVVRGKTLDTVTQAQAIETFPMVRSNLIKMSEGIYLAELVDNFLQVGEPQSNILAFLLNILDKSNDIEDKGDLLLRIFEIKLLSFTGFQPGLDNCTDCGIQLGDRKEYFFVARSGGVVCQNCVDSHSAWVRTVNADVIESIRLIQQNGINTIGKVNFTEDLLSDLEMLIRWYLNYVLDRPIEALSFLDQVRSTKGLFSS